MLIILFAFLGLIFGSFTNVLISRTKTGENPLKGRSHCDHCKKTLQWYELVPLFSFVIQGGRCRHCKKGIPLQYPLVELTMAGLFAAMYAHFQPASTYMWLVLILWLGVSIFLMADAVYDIRWHELPDQFSLSAIGLATALVVVQASLGHLGWSYIGAQLAGAAIAGSFIFAMWGFSGGRWMGSGDIRLAVIMGLLLPWRELIFAFFVAFDVGAIVALGLLLAKQKKYTDRIAFGPFLILGLYVAFFWGSQVVNWYLNLSLRLG